MTSGSVVWDRVLGYGGIVLVVVAFVSLFIGFDIDAEAVTSVVGLAMVAWMTIITVRHVQAYPGGHGRGLLIAGWVLLGALVVFAIVQAIDTAAFDDGVTDGLLSLAAAPPRITLMLPLLMASLAILRDGHTATSGGHELAAPI
jgi:hypothetical protein